MSEDKVPAKPSLLQLPLSRAAIDRAGHLRTDSEKLSQMWTNARILHFSAGKFRTIASSTEQIALDFLTPAQVKELTASDSFEFGERFFLGVDGEQPYFAWCGDCPDIEIFPQYLTLRELGAFLPDLENGLAVHTQALANWHHKHQRCPQCGGITVSAAGGSVRKCLVDESEHYPRNDPAIIVLIKDDRDRILLGRQKVWPENRFSTFAGFVEPGESFEQCVIREVQEEAGVIASEIYYLGSQPWPFPASLMIAFQAVTTNPQDARPDGEEIEEIRWYSRDGMRDAIHRQELLLPPSISVARKMIEAWYGVNHQRDLRGGQAWR
ncbi:MAG: NAD(+) diphosphatase [Actinomycetes bacterium]